MIAALGVDATQSIKDYYANISAQFTAREGKVTSYFAPGSVIYSGSTAGNTITGVGQGNPVQFGTDNMGGASGRVDMHSQALLTAGLLSDPFKTSTVAVQHALPLIMNKQLYALPTNGSDRNFLIDLIRSEQNNVGNGKLTHFAADLQKLGTNIAGLNEAAQKALIAQGIEWYYWQSTDYAGKEFFTQTGSLLQYTTAMGDKLDKAQSKADLYTRAWVEAIAAEHGVGRATFPSFGTAYDQWSVAAGSSGVSATARNAEKTQIFLGQSGADTFTGGSKDDVIFAGTGTDTLNGQGGNDKLYGGAGSDTYQFTSAFGKDLVFDADGQGTIQIDGTTLGTAKGIGTRGAWAFELGGGVYAGLAVYDDARSSTGKRLVITRGADSADTITIDNFDLSKAQGSQGYLGIKLGSTQLAITASSASNVWSDLNFNLASLSGQTSRMVEGTGKSFTVYLNQGAKAGDTVTLALSALGDKFQAILGDSVVAANGAVITLAEGQTQVSFALVQEGEVTSDASLQLSASYTGANSSATSNAWGVNLSDAGALTKTYTGDQRAPTIASGTYDWGVTSWAADGTLTGGVAEAGFADVLEGSTGNDKLSGLGGNDALDGGAGNDQIDGMGESYYLLDGDGRDVIFGDASLLGACLLRPVDYTNAATLEVSLSQQPKGSEHGDDVIDVGDGSGEDDLVNYTEMQEQGNGLIAIESIVFFTHSIGAAGQFCKNSRSTNNTNYRCAA